MINHDKSSLRDSLPCPKMTDIDSIRIHFDNDSQFVMHICLAFVMFGVALQISIEDLRRVTKFPKSLLVGLTSQWLVLPILTVYLIHAWQPYPSVALGLLLVASCPGGNMSNFMTTVAKGNAALSVSLSAIVTLSSIVFTPVVFLLFSYFVPQTKLLIQAIDLKPWQMFQTFLFLICLPLLVGMSVNHFLPKFTDKIRKPVRIVSLVIFISFILFSLVANLDNLVKYIHLVFALVVVHNLIGMAAGYYWSKWNRLSEADARAISMETGIQNSGLGLILVFTFFEDLGGMMLVVAVWAIWDMVSSLLVATYWSRKTKFKTATFDGNPIPQ